MYINVASSIVTNVLLVRDVDNGGKLLIVGAVGIWKISVPSSQFCCKPRTAINNVFLKKRKQKKFFFNSGLMYLLLQRLFKEMLQYRK